MEAARATLSARRDGMRTFAEDRSAKYEAKLSQQNADADFMAADKEEAKLRAVEASIFSMQDFVAACEREANVEPLVSELRGALVQLNQEVIKAT